MSDTANTGAPAEPAQNVEAAALVEASEPQVTEAAAPVEAAPDQTEAAQPEQSVEADQVNDDTPGIDDAEEPTS